MFSYFVFVLWFKGVAKGRPQVRFFVCSSTKLPVIEIFDHIFTLKTRVGYRYVFYDINQNNVPLMLILFSYSFKWFVQTVIIYLFMIIFIEVNPNIYVCFLHVCMYNTLLLTLKDLNSVELN